MAAVGLTREAAGADRGLARMGHRPHEVEQGEPGRDLQVVVAFDADVRACPPVGHAPPVFGGQMVEAEPAGLVGGCDGPFGVRSVPGCGLVGHDPVDDPGPGFLSENGGP